jgi:D-alanine-D-alanine ligase
MRIGFCYDRKEDYLAAGYSAAEVMEFDSEATVAGIATSLASHGHAVERVGRGVELARRLVAGERFDLVFNIAEGVWGRSREAQVPALCELFDQPYTFSDPLTCAVTLDKAMAKRVVRDAGLPTAPFAVVADPAEVADIELEPPLFVKPVAEGSSKAISGRSLVASLGELPAVCRELLAASHQPVLVETFLPGREVTVGVLGNGEQAHVLAVMEVIFTERAEVAAYTALNKDEYLERISYALAADDFAARAAELALAAYRALGCRDAARIDVRADVSGAPCFLEANPLPGLDRVKSDLPIMARLAGVAYETLLGAIVDAAAERCGVAARAATAAGA